MGLLIPVGAQKDEPAYLRRRAHMFPETRAYIIIAYSNQTNGIANIFRQTVNVNAFWNIVAIDKLICHRHVKLDKTVHLILDSLLLPSARLVVEDIRDLALLALYMGVIAS